MTALSCAALACVLAACGAGGGNSAASTQLSATSTPSGNGNPGTSPPSTPSSGGLSSGSGTGGGSTGGTNAAGAATRFIYEIFSGQKIEAFSFDESTAKVSPVPGSPYTLPNTTTPGFVTADAAGRFLFVSSHPFESCHDCNYGVFELMGYRIDQSTGALTTIPGMPMFPSQLAAVLLRPDGKFLYASIDGHYKSYSVDQATGVLTESGTVPMPSVSFDGVWSMDGMDPAGRFLYFTGQSLSGGSGEAFIGVDALDAASGIATPASDPPVDTGLKFSLPPVIASSGAVYTTGENPGAEQYGVAAMAVTPNGGLKPQPGSPYRVATIPSGAGWYSMYAAATDPLGRFVFVSGEQTTPTSEQLMTFAVQSDGSLRQSSATTGCPIAAIDGTGNYLFNSAQAQPWVFRINSSDGSLSLVNSLPQNQCAEFEGEIVAVP